MSMLPTRCHQSVVSYEGHAVWRLRVTSEDAHAVVANATRTFGADLWAEYAFTLPPQGPIAAAGRLAAFKGHTLT